MQIKEAIVERIKNICLERGMKYNELATRSGVTPSTVYSMLDPSCRDSGTKFLQKFILQTVGVNFVCLLLKSIIVASLQNR